MARSLRASAELAAGSSTVSISLAPGSETVQDRDMPLVWEWAGKSSRRRLTTSEGAAMPEQRRPESADLTDDEVLDASDSRDGDPGDDPLDRGVAAPQRWSAAIRYGGTPGEQQAGESLDQLLAEEEPDVA